MRQNTFILDLFNIKNGELKTVSILFSYSFFIGISYAFLYTTATSLFLGNFKMDMLPFAYMGGGVFNYLLWRFYHKFEKKLFFSRLSLFGALFLLISLSTLAIGYILTENKWFAFFLFIWINVFLFFIGVGFWGIAAKIFDLRQGKRLFGLIGSGEILSKILSFFSVPFILKFLETKQLLLFVLIGFVLSIFLLLIILKRYKNILAIPVVSKNNSGGQEPEKKGLFDILKNKYFALIIILALFPLFAAYYVDFIFLDQTKSQFVGQDLISSFLGIFFGFMSITEFFLKSIVSGRLISKYGILLSLILLPLLLLFSTVSASIYGTLYGATAMFFSFILLSKLFVRVLRTAFLDPSFQILYQPIPSNERLAFQSKVEGVPKSIGNIIVGLMLILFTNISSLTLVHYNYIFIVILIAWLWISKKLFLEYRVTLKNILVSKNGTPGFSKNDKSTLHTVNKVIQKEKEPNFNLLMNIINHTEPSRFNLFLQHILTFLPISTQEKILRQIINKHQLSAAPIIKNYLETNPNIKNNEIFVTTLKAFADSGKIDIETLSRFCDSNNPKEKLQAAQLLPYSDRYKSLKLLIGLLQDKNPQIRKAALVSSGRVAKPQLWPYIIKNLFDITYSNTAIKAIKIIGNPILEELDNHFEKHTTPKQIKLKIIAVYSRIKGEHALQLLKARIQYPEGDVRHAVLKALSKREYHATLSDSGLVKKAIEEEIAMIVWVMAAQNDIQKEADLQRLSDALKFELNRKKENVFLLLSMLYDSKTILYIRESLKSETSESKVFATEILDLTVSEEIKKLLLPFIEASSLEESIRLYGNLFPQQKLKVFERLNDIVNKDYTKINRWTKACALILMEGFHENERVLDRKSVV